MSQLVGILNTNIMRHKQTKSELSRILNYLVTGGAWFWSGYGMFALLYGGIGMDVVSAKVISYIFGLSVNFTLERLWVFPSDDPSKNLDKVTLKYIFLSVVNLFIDTAIVWSLSEAGITPYIGQFVSAGFFTIWNYLWYKLWVFAKKTSPGAKRAAAPSLKRPKRVHYHTRPRKA